VISTDIRKDGRLEGPALNVYRDIKEKLPETKLIASGGVTSLQDLEELRKMDCYGAIVGKTIYEGRISLKQLRSFI
jgi:phosphoribosylformimino-5-aminoimidazole carboxamide ribotide isomerase